jgi:sulfur carrier protein ThiS adenylyltransferase
MLIEINGKAIEESESMSLLDIKDKYKKDADIVILNGFPTKVNSTLSLGDTISLIKYKEIPKEDELECLLTSRHTPGVHEKVKDSIVAIAGLGGLGSNVAISLARLGIGGLRLVDFDVVEPSNLNRQQYFIKNIGQKKTEALSEIIRDINPYVKTESFDVFVNEKNVVDLFDGVDVIVEAFDNPKTKSMFVNKVLSELDIPIVAASGLAGFYSSNTIVTKKIRKNFYMVGDMVSGTKPGSGLMAPRAAIAANHQANQVLRIILGEFDT